MFKEAHIQGFVRVSSPRYMLLETVVHGDLLVVE